MYNESNEEVKKMRIVISNEEKRKIGKMIRWLRIDANLTQQQLILKSNAISLRSLISLEKGGILKDDEIYDHLLQAFALHINYQESEDYLDELYNELLHAYEYYDNARIHELSIKYKQSLMKYKDCINEYFIIRVLDILKDLWTNQTILNYEQFNFLYSIHDFLDYRLQYLVEDALYTYEYNVEHIDAKLEDMFQKYHCMKKVNITRYSIGVILHLHDKHQDYLNAFIILLKREKAEKKNKNEQALFSIYHWMSILSVRIYPNEFESYLKKAFLYMEKSALSNHNKRVFYHNIANCYHWLQNYEQEMFYHYKSLKYENTYNLLPQYIWMCASQYQIDKTLPSINFAQDISDCSDKLIACWQYFILKKQNANVYELEEYIMKTLMPYLEELAYEFKVVYKIQLYDLIKETRNYKNLLIYMEKLNI